MIETMRIKGLNQYKDRHGRLRRYHRATGTPIDPSLEGLDLANEVARLDRKYAEKKARPGTLGLLIDEYQRKSDHWRNLRPRTQKDYHRVFKYLDEVVEARGAKLIDIRPVDIVTSRDMARDRHEPKFANLMVSVLKQVFKFALEYGHMESNPAIGVSKAAGGNKRPNRPFAPSELTTLIDNAPNQLLGPIYTAALYGLRQGDVLKLSKTCIDGNWLRPVTSKRMKPVWLPLTPTMQRIIDDQQNGNAVQIFVNSKGSPWTTDGFRSTWSTYKTKLEKAGLIDEGGTFHGIRTTAQVILDEHGFANEIKYLVAHAPKDVTEHYTITSKRKEIVMEMVNCIENVINEARGNVVRFQNKV